jgi:hypothetical protein
MSCPRCCWARAASGFVVIFTGAAAEQCARDYRDARMAGSISPIPVGYVKVWRHARELVGKLDVLRIECRQCGRFAAITLPS